MCTKTATPSARPPLSDLSKTQAQMEGRLVGDLQLIHSKPNSEIPIGRDASVTP